MASGGASVASLAPLRAGFLHDLILEAKNSPKTVQSQDLPKPGPGENRFVLRNMDQGNRKGRKVVGEGNVQFEFRGYVVTCDRVDGDLETEIFVLHGNVVVVGDGRSLTAERVIVDFKNRTFEYDKGWAEVEPDAQSGLTGPLYVSGDSGTGLPGRLTLRESSITTCDRDDEHFHFEGEEVDTIAGRRAVLRRVKLKVLGRTVLTIPTLVIPLNRKIERFTPEVGQTREEGYYIKTLWSTPGRGADTVSYRADYFTRLGAGLGVDLDYETQRLGGLARAYSLFGSERTRLFSSDHRQVVGRSTVTFLGQWIQNNYLTDPLARNYSGRLNLVTPTDRGQFRVTLNRNSSKTPAFGSLNENFGVSWDERVTNSLRTNLNLDYGINRSKGFGALSERKTVNVSFRGNQDLRKGDALLEYQRVIPVGENVNFFSSSDKTPVLTLSTESRKWLGRSERDRVPVKLEFSIGELIDSVRRNQVTRSHFEIQSQNRFSTEGRHEFSYSVLGRQGLYSDDTAQYNWGGNFNYSYLFGSKNRFNLRYSNRRQFGFTPLAIDRIGENNELQADLAWQVLRSLSLSAQSSFDFVQFRRSQTPWQGVGLRSDWRPNNRFQLRASSNYDTFNQVWSNVRFDSGWQVAGGFLGIGARYDGLRHTWGAVNIIAEQIRWGKLTTSALLNYNGYRKRFDSRQIAFIYDLHCTEAILQINDQSVGFRRGTEVSFFLRIKALPFDTNFGTGRRGQPVGTGTGINL